MGYSLYNQIYGSLLAAALGDIIGGPSETQSRDEIYKNFHGRITSLHDGRRFGRSTYGKITDDTSQLYMMGKVVVKYNGKLNPKRASEGILMWADECPEYYPRCAGPTSRYVIEALRAGQDPEAVGKRAFKFQFGTSNGAVMRIAPAGLINPGNPDGAVQTAIAMTKPSHNTHQAYSASCAIACAIAEALTENSSIHSVLRAAIYGAKEGERIGRREARIAPGGLITPALLEAIEIVYDCETAQEAEVQLDRAVNANICTARASVPMAIGLFAINRGDPLKTAFSCANAGGDTDTFGCMAGMIAGAFSGIASIPPKWQQIYKEYNPEYDLDWMAKELTRIAQTRMQPVKEVLK